MSVLSPRTLPLLDARLNLGRRNQFMNRLISNIVILSCICSSAFIVAGCGGDHDDPGQPNRSGNKDASQSGSQRKPYVPLVEARKGFKTTLLRKVSAGEPLDQPSKSPHGNGFSIVKYDAPGGKYPAYLYTPDAHPLAKDEKKSAIIWITGGDCNTIGDVWSPADKSSDENATAYRDAGLIMMFPSMRGGNENPGFQEGFFGEVDDVLAARDWLAKQPNVDADRIYLGGHSTGGTLALLVAECSDQFRAVFSFGPVENVAFYGPDFLPFDFSNSKEIKLRAPGNWLKDIRTPTFIIEGTKDGNYASLISMKGSRNTNVHTLPIKGADHFNVLAPINKLIATRVMKDTQPTCNLKFNTAELDIVFQASQR